MKRINAILVLVLCMALAPSCGKSAYPTANEAELQGVVRTSLDSPDPTEAQLARRAKNNEAVKAMGLPCLEGLPVVEDDSTVIPRTPEEVASRCLAVALCAVKGETQDQALIDAMVIEFDAGGYFSPEEARFIRNTSPAEQERINFAWRYECAHVLLWALGYVDELKPPSEICDVAREMGYIRDAGKEGFVPNAKLRPMSEVLDMADLYYRLHWAAVELRISGKTSAAIDGGIIQERHRALNWLIRYMDQAWDNVTTDT